MNNEGSAGPAAGSGSAGAESAGAESAGAGCIGRGLPTQASLRQYEAWMRRALAVAQQTSESDVPVGAIVVGPDGRQLSSARNEREVRGDPTAHAEVLALRSAAAEWGDGWRLNECTLIVTLEPCAMCAGAALLSRVGRIVFGAYEPKTGACGSVVDILRDPTWPTAAPEVIGGILEEDNAQLLRSFFDRRRAGRFGV